MDTLVFIVLFFAVGRNPRTIAAPSNALNIVVSNGVDDAGAEDGPLDDDFTTHGLERLSSAATCLVAGVEYTHGQQIARADPCEFCLCLDGEMFCWWQDCPPTMEGPCRDRGPFTPCLNNPASSTMKSTTLESSTTDALGVENSTDFSTFSADVNATDEATPSTSQSRFCVVMGHRYEIGDKLPHDTGNCVECVCAQGGKVTCFPHQCAPAGEDINDYRPPGPLQSDVF